MNREQQEDDQAKVSRLCRDATFSAFRAVRHISGQSERPWRHFDTLDCMHHLNEALSCLRQIDETIATLPERKQ